MEISTLERRQKGPSCSENGAISQKRESHGPKSYSFLDYGSFNPLLKHDFQCNLVQHLNDTKFVRIVTVCHAVTICASTCQLIFVAIDELSSMKRKTIRIVPQRSSNITPGREPNGSKINLLVSGREGVDRALHIELGAVLHEKALGYSTITKSLRSARFGERDAVQADSDDMLDADLVD